MGRQESAAAHRFVALSPDDGSTIDLRHPALAALLSWLVPGLGQIYQGRRLKGALFMATLLSAFLAGMWVGDGRVVYASWKPGEKRWAFLCQAGIGVAALPAMMQTPPGHQNLSALRRRGRPAVQSQLPQMPALQQFVTFGA